MAHLIQLQPSGQTFHADAHETILEAAERAGVTLRHGCRIGACRTCVARLLGGHLTMPSGTGLSDADIAADLVLLCIARAQTAVLLESRPGLGPAVGVLPRPWTD